MTQEEKSQAQDVLNGLLRDSYQTGYNQGFADGLAESKKVSRPVESPASFQRSGSTPERGPLPSAHPLPPTDGTDHTRDAQRQQDPTGIRACLDCRHCETIPSYGPGLSEKHFCLLASRLEPDPVTGRMCYAEKVHCWKERQDGSCGPEGRNFERKSRILGRLFG